MAFSFTIKPVWSFSLTVAGQEIKKWAHWAPASDSHTPDGRWHKGRDSGLTDLGYNLAVTLTNCLTLSQLLNILNLGPDPYNRKERQVNNFVKFE